MSDLTTIATYSVFIASYLVFAMGKFPGMKIDRAGAAIIGAVLMFTTGAVRANNALYLMPVYPGAQKSPLHSSYERGCQAKTLLHCSP